MKIAGIVAVIMFMLIVAALPFAVEASGQHHHHNHDVTVVNNVTVNPKETITQKVTEDNSGTAAAIASSQHHFDMSTLKTQVSIAVGSFEDDEAVSVGIGKRFDNILINGSISAEGSERGYGAAIGLKF